MFTNLGQITQCHKYICNKAEYYYHYIISLYRPQFNPYKLKSNQAKANSKDKISSENQSNRYWKISAPTFKVH